MIENFLSSWGLSTFLQFPFCHVASTVSYWQTLSSPVSIFSHWQFMWSNLDSLLIKENYLAILFQIPSISTAEELPQNEHAMPNPGVHNSDSLTHHISSVLDLCVGRQKFPGRDLSKTRRGQCPCSAFPGQVHQIIKAAQQQQWPFFFFLKVTQNCRWLEGLNGKSASSPCTSLACSLIVALKEPVNKVLEASLKKRAQAQRCPHSRRLLWESPRCYE